MKYCFEPTICGTFKFNFSYIIFLQKSMFDFAPFSL